MHEILTLIAEQGLSIAPSETAAVQGERGRIPAEAANAFFSGAPLEQVRSESGTPTPGVLDAASVVVRHEGRVLEAGKDYQLDGVWGVLGLPEQSSLGPDTEVAVDYRVWRRRIDTLVACEEHYELVQGESAAIMAMPPQLGAGKNPVANVFVEYGNDVQVLPLDGSVDVNETDTTAGLVPTALAKLSSGEPIKIVFWGDSVTEGGEASTPEKAYPQVFERLLCERFPRAQLELEVVAVGGSESRNWLDGGVHPHPTRQGECDLQRIVEARPDVVTIEFVNDCHLLTDAQGFDEHYRRILDFLSPLGCEVILITPHYTCPEMMGGSCCGDRDPRPYTRSLKDFATRKGVAVADASSRWGHLAAMGIPYVTLLRNGINHPDDRGHRFFAEELIKCFA